MSIKVTDFASAQQAIQMFKKDAEYQEEIGGYLAVIKANLDRQISYIESLPDSSAGIRVKTNLGQEFKNSSDRTKELIENSAIYAGVYRRRIEELTRQFPVPLLQVIPK